MGDLVRLALDPSAVGINDPHVYRGTIPSTHEDVPVRRSFQVTFLDPLSAPAFEVPLPWS